MPLALSPKNNRPNARKNRGSSIELRLELLEDRRLPSTYGQLPLSFEANQGQGPSGMDFIARGSGYSVALSATDASFVLHRAGSPDANALVDLRLIAADPGAAGQGVNQLAGVSNYLIGNDPSRWHTGVAQFGSVQYANVYPAIDVVYHGNQGQLEYDFIVKPGAHVGAIRLGVDGATSLSLDAQGNLIVHTAGGELVEKAPVLYQDVAGIHRSVAGRYVLRDNHQVGFAVGAYDASAPLVIDPVFSYSSYLGGSGSDAAYGIAVDETGSVYVTGYTSSTNFPTVNPLQPNRGGSGLVLNAFVTKLDPSGTTVVFSTYVGGSGGDAGVGIALDNSNNIYVVGTTSSSDFPTAGAPFQQFKSGGQDTFVAKLNPLGNALVYSTFLGGSGDEKAGGIAVNSAGNAFVTGQTGSTNFPTASPAQSTLAGPTNAFVAELSTSGGSLVYSTYLGGSGSGTKGDAGNGIGVDGSGNAYVTGFTNSTNFPTLNALQSISRGGQDAFVTKFSSNGALAYSTFLSGSGDDLGVGIAVDGSGNAYVTGWTRSTNFPTATGAAQSAHAIDGGQNDGFVTKLTPTGGMLYSTYLGGGGEDEPEAIAVDRAGFAYVVGVSNSTDFPVGGGAPQAAYRGGGDAFVAELAPAGNGLIYSTYLGGSGADQANAVAADRGGSAYVAGVTSSSDFPVLSAAQPRSGGGTQDAFVTKIGLHAWHAQDVAVGSDNNSRLLWQTPDGSNDIWSLNSSLAATAGPVYGAYSGWISTAEAAGADGLTRVLWTNANGTAALWLNGASGAVQKSQLFGPFAGWTATDVAVASDGKARLLWVNGNGQAVVWSVDNNFNVTSGPVYGPFAGWRASKLDAGADGLIRLLWNNANGAAALWLLNLDGSLNSSAVFGPLSGWTATDVAVGADGHTRMLWTNFAGPAAIWNVTNAFAVTATVYGPFAGWSATALSAGNDGILRLLWDNVDGTAALWLLDAAGTVQNSATFGPF